MIILAYKDTAGHLCHIGLGVTALNLAASLSDDGFPVETWGVLDGYVLRDKLRTRPDVTHVIMLAPWIDTGFMRQLTGLFPRIQFTVTCHSNVGFLQCDAWSMKTICEQMELERDRLNFKVSGNCRAYCNWIPKAYNRPCVYLPNLYHMQMNPIPRQPYHSGPLRIGVFGATRLLKNMGTAMAAALVIANQLQAETEVWVSGGREEGGKGIIASCHAMLIGAPHVKIVESPWQSWAQFHSTARRMHLMMQPSFTESFNNVTADGIGQGVASVVSPAIEWAPEDWQADPDDAVDLAYTGIRLLRDANAPKRGLKALVRHNRNALAEWREYLGSDLKAA